MSNSANNTLWTLEEDDFIKRIKASSLPGVFKKTLQVEAGTRALIVQGIEQLGEVGAGTHEISSPKDTLAFLARTGDCLLEFDCPEVRTSERMLVDVGVRLAVRVENIGLAVRNLSNAHKGMKLEELRETVEPIATQGLREAVSGLSITDLTGKNARAKMDAATESALGSAMARYGIAFDQVHAISIRHLKYDAHLDKLEEAWLLKDSVEHQEALFKLYSKEEYQKIKLQERMNDLNIFAHQVETDHEEGKLAVRRRKIAILNELREALVAGQIQKIKSEEDLAEALKSKIESRLLRENELEELKRDLAEGGEDHQWSREHLLRKIELERKVEIELLQADVDHRLKMKSLDYEIELAQRVETEESRQWVGQLERERRQSARDHERFEQDLCKKRQWAKDLREEEFEKALHEARMADLDRGRKEKDAQSEARIVAIKVESKALLDRQELNRKKQEAELDGERREQQIKFIERSVKANESIIRTQAEALREIERGQTDDRIRVIDAHGNSTPEQLMHDTDDPSKIAAYADIIKHRDTQKTAQIEAQSHAAANQAAAEAKAVAEAKVEAMLEKVTEAQKEKADAAVRAYQEAMIANQALAGKALDTAESLGQSAAQAPLRTMHQSDLGHTASVPMAFGSSPTTPAPASQPTHRAEPVAPQTTACPRCHRHNEAGLQKCKFCGTTL